MILSLTDWTAWEDDRKRRAAEDLKRVAANDAPDQLLAALRDWKPDAYTCCPQPNRWRADCPSCAGHRTVRITSHQEGRGVTAWCAGGCSQQQIIDALASLNGPVDWRDEAIRWWEIATEAQALLHKAQRSIDWLIDDIAAGEMERAA